MKNWSRQLKYPLHILEFLEELNCVLGNIFHTLVLGLLLVVSAEEIIARSTEKNFHRVVRYVVVLLELFLLCDVKFLAGVKQPER